MSGYGPGPNAPWHIRLLWGVIVCVVWVVGTASEIWDRVTSPFRK